MRIPRRPALMILTLCLLVMQVQVWASAVLGCQHSVGLTGNTAAVCPLHHASAAKATHGHPGGLLVCQRCVLHCAIGMHVIPASAPLWPDMDSRQLSAVAPEVHFYRFTPPFRYRPPISRLL
jgi:hypothetical protein